MLVHCLPFACPPLPVEYHKRSQHIRFFRSVHILHSAVPVVLLLLQLSYSSPSYLLFSMTTSLHQTWSPACPHQEHTGDSILSKAEPYFMCTICKAGKQRYEVGNDSNFAHRPSPCTRLGSLPVHTKSTLETASYHRQSPTSCVQLANQVHNFTSLPGGRRVELHAQATSLHRQSKHTKGTLETAA